MPASMAGVILEEAIDENYEPTEEEVVEYARWLGMSLPREEELLWIAREGVKAVLPENWRPCRSEDGDIYFFNFMSGESVWDHPCDEYYRSLYKEERRKLAEEREEAEYQESLSAGYQSSSISPHMPPAVVAGSHAELLGFGPVKSLDAIRRKPLPALGDRGKSVDVGLAATVPATSSLSHGVARSTAEVTAAISLPASPATATDSSIFSRDNKGSDASADCDRYVTGGVEPGMWVGRGEGGGTHTMVQMSGRRFCNMSQFPPAMGVYPEAGGKKWQGRHSSPVRVDRRLGEPEVGGGELETGSQRHIRDGSGTASTSTTTDHSERSGPARAILAAGTVHQAERREISVQSDPSLSSDSKSHYYGRTFSKKRSSNMVRLTAGDLRGGMRTVGPFLERTASGQPGVFWQSDTESTDSMSMHRPPVFHPGERVMEVPTVKKDDKKGQPSDGRKPAGVQTAQPTDQQLEMVRRWKEQDQKESAALQAIENNMDPIQLQQQLLLQMFQKQSTEEHSLYLRQRQEMEVRVMERLKEEERELTKKLRAALNQRIEKEVQKEEEKLKSMKVASMQAKLSQEAEDIHSKIWEVLEAQRQQRVNAMEAEAQQLQEDEKHLNELRKQVESAARKLNEDEQIIKRRAKKFAEERDDLLQKESAGIEEGVRRRAEEMKQEMLEKMLQQMQEDIEKQRQAELEALKQEIDAVRQEMLKESQQELRAEAEAALVKQFMSMETRTAFGDQGDEGRKGAQAEAPNEGRSIIEECLTQELVTMKERISKQVEDEERSLIEEKRKEASERVAAMLKDMEHQRGEIASQIEAKLETERKRMEEEMKERLLMISKGMKAEEARWTEKQHHQERERERMEVEAKAYFEKFDEAAIREQVAKEMKDMLAKEMRPTLEESLRQKLSKEIEDDVRQSLTMELQEVLRKDMEDHKRQKMEEAEREVNAEVEKWRKDRMQENMGKMCRSSKESQQGETGKEEHNDCAISLVVAVNVAPSGQQGQKDVSSVHDGAEPGSAYAGNKMSCKDNDSPLDVEGVMETGKKESETSEDVEAVANASIESHSLESSVLRQDLERQVMLEVSNAKRDLEQRADRVHREAEEEMRRREMLLKEELKQLVDGKQNAILRRLKLDVDPSCGGKVTKLRDMRNSKRGIGIEGRGESRSGRQLEKDKVKTQSTSAKKKEDRGIGTVSKDSKRSADEEWSVVYGSGASGNESVINSWNNGTGLQLDVNQRQEGLASEEVGCGGFDWWASLSEGKVGELHGNPSARESPLSGARSWMRKLPALVMAHTSCSSEVDVDDEMLSQALHEDRSTSTRCAGPPGNFREPLAKWENMPQENPADRERRLATEYVRREHLRLKEGKMAIERARECWQLQLQAYRKLTDRSRGEARKYTLQEAKLEIERQAQTLNTKAQKMDLSDETSDQSTGIELPNLKARPTMSAPASPTDRLDFFESCPDTFKGWATIYGSDMSRIAMSPREQQENKCYIPPQRDSSVRLGELAGHPDTHRRSPTGIPLTSPSMNRKVRNGSLEQREMLANLKYKYSDGQQAAREVMSQHSKWLTKFRDEISAAGLSLRYPTLRPQESLNQRNNNNFIKL